MPFIQIFAIFLITFMSFGTAVAQPAKVAVVPFKINAEKDLTFLRDGIADMLASRLSWENKVVVLDRQTVSKAAEGVAGPLNPDAARSLGAKLAADYVLFGSLTVFGNSVSMDAAMVDTAGKSAPLTVYNQSQGMEEVIPRINLFAEEINEKVFGRQTTVRQLAAPPPEPSSGTYAHPEKLLTSNEDDEGEQSAIRGAKGIGMKSGFWKSQSFKEHLRGMSLADVDGDGKTEAVLMSERSVSVHRVEAGRMNKLAEYKGEHFQRFLTVDAADIKKDGRAEIFVTGITTNDRSLDSFVLELSGNQLVPIVRGARWYYRVIENPGTGKMLIGQRSGATELFIAGIFELTWSGSAYVSGKSLSLPKQANVFSFNVGKFFDDGRECTAVFDDADHIGLFLPSGEREWKSEESYGGSELFLLLPGQTEDRYFIPQRILVSDLDSNGQHEVVTVQHRSVSGRLFKNFRQFSGAQCRSLVWDGLGLNSLWHTREVSGYACDFAVGDIDNDGKLEIAMTVVSRRESPLETPRSSVIAFDLDAAPSAAKNQ